MVDLARHFIPLPLIKRTVDGMALSKLNVLHLHLTDAQSFPVQLEDKPGLNLSQLAKLGSFGNNQDKVYSKQGLRELVTYAAQRGIEVVSLLSF
jgi:hexosaminidase